MSSSYLQEEVEKDLSVVLEEDLLEEVLAQECRVLCWDVLLDHARALPQDQLQELKERHDKLSMDQQDLQALTGHMLEVLYCYIKRNPFFRRSFASLSVPVKLFDTSEVQWFLLLQLVNLCTLEKKRF